MDRSSASTSGANGLPAVPKPLRQLGENLIVSHCVVSVPCPSFTVWCLWWSLLGGAQGGPVNILAAGVWTRFDATKSIKQKNALSSERQGADFDNVGVSWRSLVGVGGFSNVDPGPCQLVIASAVWRFTSNLFEPPSQQPI